MLQIVQVSPHELTHEERPSVGLKRQFLRLGLIAAPRGDLPPSPGRRSLGERPLQVLRPYDRFKRACHRTSLAPSLVRAARRGSYAGGVSEGLLPRQAPILPTPLISFNFLRLTILVEALEHEHIPFERVTNEEVVRFAERMLSDTHEAFEDVREGHLTTVSGPLSAQKLSATARRNA